MANKLFTVINDGTGEIAYVQYKNFTMINVVSAILFLGFVPFLIVMVLTEITTIVLTVIATLLILVYYIYLWRGEAREKIKYNNGEVMIIDEDLAHKTFEFHIKDLHALEIKSVIGSHVTGFNSARPQNIPNSIKLELILTNDIVIHFGSSCYGGQLKQIRNYIIGKYNNYQPDNSAYLALPTP